MDVDGSRMRELRLAKMLTQQELATQSDTTESTVNRLENSLQRARISTVRKLAGALGVEPQALLRTTQSAQDES